jgi:hypothetical protein
MTARDQFRAVMAHRRAAPKGTAERAYLTRAARKLAWIARGIPTTEWSHP